MPTKTNKQWKVNMHTKDDVGIAPTVLLVEAKTLSGALKRAQERYEGDIYNFVGINLVGEIDSE